MSAFYGLEALRRMREERATRAMERQPSLLEQVPPDAPADNATLTVWNGERFIAYDKWLATRPISADLARCDAEIAHAEEQLRAGHPDIPGLVLALSDWAQEKRLIQAEMDLQEPAK